ncbi:transglycosylase domain-containing protein [Isachenkonia alkalipeptolytica]|uniref:Penicillin-binding protein 1A n=1 Tax=Isachenkonia alkalipeptolytica TaxID=2565777 RepID=A0AA44BFB9_9CLOT|nr:transglycosylase domain-containing protein [Isachenkonia alkalipeptolytica]NBG88391.1 penicillin-binding protein [Isachenkonia alkalipeptolytica]
MSYEKNTRAPKSKKKNNKTLKTILKSFGLIMILLLIAAVLAGGFALSFVQSAIDETPDIDPQNMYSLLGENSFIYDNEGNQLERIDEEEQRIIVDYSEIPDHVIDAFIAIEDARFWEHDGLDFRRIAGAAWTNFRTGSQQGGSTITQQLAKNLYLSHDQTYTRKIQDAYYAVEIENILAKDQILETYLNTINLGGQNYGVEAASLAYFSKPVSELNLVEGAALAGIARNPSRYSPIRYVPEEDVTEEMIVLDESGDYIIIFDERSLPRLRLVLKMMKQHDFITEEEHREALGDTEDLHSRIEPGRYEDSGISSHFADLVKDEVKEALIEEGYTEEEASRMLGFGGLRVHSTLDRQMQEIAEEEFNNRDNFPKNVLDDDGNLLRDEHGNVQPQAAMVISDPETGEIKAFMGGRETSGRRIFNRATGRGRPTGSSMKPLAAYIPALDNNHTAASVIDDIPIYFRNDPEERGPRNVGNTGYLGLINLREGIRISSNVTATILLDELAPTRTGSQQIMAEYLSEMGINIPEPNYSHVLGSADTSPYQMNRAYNMIANEGVYSELISFTHVEDAKGNVILENRPEKHRVVDPDVAYLMTDIMRHAVTPANEGYGWQAAIRKNNAGIPVAGKTGTSQEQKDAWFVGYTPYLSAATWIGFDEQEELGSSSVISAELWSKIMGRIHDEKEYPNKDFERPDNIIEVEICATSGKLPTELCEQDPRGSQVTTELFIRGTEPTEECDVHQLVKIHEPTGTIATDETPSDEIEERLYIVPPEPYDPDEHDGIRPRDYEYRMPTSYDDRETYDPSEHGSGSVSVRYMEVDEDGEIIGTLRDSREAESGRIGTSYSTRERSFEGYEFVGVDPSGAPREGNIEEGTQRVTYLYRAVEEEEPEPEDPPEDDDDDDDDDEDDGNDDDDDSNND